MHEKGKKVGRKKERKKGRKEERKKGRKEGRKKGRKEGCQIECNDDSRKRSGKYGAGGGRGRHACRSRPLPHTPVGSPKFP